jgi:alkylation response protein AidB-like acyl-CoA dehydrogenase
MAIAITDAHRELATVTRSFLDARGARAHARELLDAADETMPPYWKDAADLGWLGLHVPEEHGGAGYGLSELVVVLEELGRTLAAGPFLATTTSSALLVRAGSDAQRARYLPSLADGSRVAALGLGGDVRVDDDGSLTGDAGLVLGAALADVLLVRVDGDLVLIDRFAPGVTVDMPSCLDPSRRVGRVQLASVSVEPDAWLRDAVPVARSLSWLVAAADAAGGAQECVAMASAYAKDRQQFGRPIGMFQAVKHHCANMLVAAETATAAVWDAARAANGAPDQFELACAAAAARALPAFTRNAQLNIQIHGGVGFTWEHDGHLFLRRAATLGALHDPGVAASSVTRASAEGVARQHDFELPPDAEVYRAEARAVAADLAALDPDAQLARLIDTGYVQPHWPTPWGRAAKAVEQLVIDAEFKRAGVQRPNYGITGWIVLTLLQHGTEQQIERWVRPTLERELVWCQLFSEPDAGSDAAGVRTRAVRVEGGWEISGQKVWTSGAQFCQRGLATVRTDPDVPKHAGITAVVVDMHAEGVEVRPLREATGAAMFNEVFFDRVFVPDDDVVGAVDNGWAVARSTLGNERVSIGSGAVFGPDVVDLYRRHGGDDATTKAVGMHVAEAMSMRALELRRVERAVTGGEPGPEGNVSKLLTAEHSQRSAELGLALLGAEGAVLEGEGQAVGQAMLFSRALTIAGGTSEITRSQIGERILGLPRDPLLN